MAKRRKGLTDDVSLDVKLSQGAVVSLKVKNLRTGSVKLINFSIADLFETEDVPDEEETVPQTKESDVPSIGGMDVTGPSAKFTGTVSTDTSVSLSEECTLKDSEEDQSHD